MTHHEIIADLQDYFGRKMTDSQFRFYVSESLKINNGLLERAAKDCKRGEKLFPTLKVIEGYVAQVREWASATTTTATHLPQLKPSEPECIKEGFRLLALAWRRPKTKEERDSLVAQCRMMDQVWPGRGWTEAAKQLQDWYAKPRNTYRPVSLTSKDIQAEMEEEKEFWGINP